VNVILAILISLSALFAPTAQPATPGLGLIESLESQAPHIPSKLAGCEEDNPCWDCRTMGNKICGPTPSVTQPLSAPALTLASVTSKAPVTAPHKATSKATHKATITAPTAKLATEAWAAFSPRVFTASELSKPMRVSYVGTTASPNDLPNGHEWYTIPTVRNGHVHHVFEIEFNYKK